MQPSWRRWRTYSAVISALMMWRRLKVVDGLYFAVATLTTSSIAEIARHLGIALIEIRRQEKAAKA